MYLVRHPASNHTFLFLPLLGVYQSVANARPSYLHLPVPAIRNCGPTLQFPAFQMEFLCHFTQDDLGVTALLAESFFLPWRQVNDFPNLVEGRGQLPACLQDIWVLNKLLRRQKIQHVDVSTCWNFCLLNSLSERPCCIERRLSSKDLVVKGWCYQHSNA